VVFDFDGTLTKPGTTRTTWESIWAQLGYDDSECGRLAAKFFRKEISHAEWCNTTLSKFREKGLTQKQVVRTADGLHLVKDLDEVLSELSAMNIPVFIVSGSIWDVITTALGQRTDLFKNIAANTFGYNSSGVIGTITGTKFDFEGKADYIREIAKNLNLSPSDILFIGNSINDIHVKSSGARTLLVNPHFTNPSDGDAWDFYIPRMNSLMEIIPYVDTTWEARRKEKLRASTKTILETLRGMSTLRLSDLTVLGNYRRYDNEQRATLKGLADRISGALTNKTATRENFLIHAAPGSGKTFLIEELARSLGNSVCFVAIDLSRDDKATCETKLHEVKCATLPCLCMIDEIDGRKDQDWPYDTFYKSLDLNESTSRPAVVFVLIGSSGASTRDLGDAIRARYKGKDMIDRIPESSHHCTEVPSMVVGDTLCVYASKVIEAAAENKKVVESVEMMAAFHAATICRSPRQIKMLADQAVKRIAAGRTQLHYDDHFEAGDRNNKSFWNEHSDATRELAGKTIQIAR
jgi:phosphoserine phosphatase